MQGDLQTPIEQLNVAIRGLKRAENDDDGLDEQISDNPSQASDSEVERQLGLIETVSSLGNTKQFKTLTASL